MVISDFKYYNLYIIFFMCCVIGNNFFTIPLYFSLNSIRFLTIIYCIYFIFYDNNGFILILYNKHNYNYFFFLILLLILATFQLIYVNNFYEGFKLVFNLHFQFYFILCLYIIINKFENFNKTLFYSFFYSVTITLIVAIYELALDNHLESSNLFISQLPFYAKNLKFASSFFANPNNCSYFLVLALYFLILYNNYNTNILIKKINKFYIFILIPIILIFNQSSLSLFVYFFTITYFFFNNYKFLLFIIFSLLFVFFNKFYDLFFDYIHLQLFSQSFDERYNHIKNLFYYSFENPFLGLGPKQYESLVRHFFNTRVSNPHNFFIEITLNHGIPLAFFILFLLLNKLYKNLLYKRYDTLFFNFIFILLLTQNSGYLDNLIFWLFLSFYLFEFKNIKYS
jgi:hypothetical protein